LVLPAGAQTSNPIPGKWYEYYVVARTGATTGTKFTDLGSGGGPSINDVREVAFRGSTSAGNALWFGTGQAASVNFNPGESFSSSDIIGPSVQINSNHQVVSEDRITTTSPASTNIRLYNANSTDSYIYAARGGPFETGQGVYLYPAVFANPGTNLNGDVVFTAANPNGGTSKILGVLQHGATSPIQQTIFSGSPMPMIADDGTVVIQVGGSGTQTNNQILVYPPGLASPVVIADTAANWNSLDNAPGISRDGIVIAFQGNPNAVEAAAIGTTVGPGIFAAVNEGSGWSSAKIIRLTGTEVENITADKAAGKGNLDGICNTGEICTPAAELGWDAAGNKITIASYPAGSRVGVAHVDFGPPGIDYDTFVVSFVATPSEASRPNPWVPTMPLLFSAQQGLWTIRVDVQKQLDPPNGRVYHASSPIPVVQIGDHLGPDTVTGIAVYDPIANAAYDENGDIRTMRRGDHRVAFWASTNNGQIIVRANHLDSDQDGLLDHWETTGIDMDQDGVVDFEPSLYGANPFARDVFLQVDNLVGFQNQVQPRVFNYDIPGSYSYFETNFRNAEVLSGAMYGARIDGAAPADIVAGIIPHVDAGPGPDLAGLSPSINLNGMPAIGGNQISMPGEPTVAPDVIYYGLPGSINVPGINALSLDQAKDTYFGKNDKDAREFIFHYAVFGGFQDFVPNVTLGQGNPASVYIGSVTSLSLNSNVLDASALPPGVPAWSFVRMLSGANAGFLAQISAVGTDKSNGSPAFQTVNPFPEALAVGDTFVLFEGSTGLAEVFFFALGAEGAGDSNSLGGNDILISLSPFGTPSANGVLGSECQQWETIEHELGHTLGLRHGGTDNLTSGPPARVKGTAYLSMMSYSWDLDCTVPYPVTTYSSSTDKTFDDFANMRMDFPNVMFHMGNSFGFDLGSFAMGDLAATNPEPNYSLYVAQNGPLDTVAPAVSITSPAANSGVNGTLTVNVTASDNVAIDSVSVLFDVNGNGVMDVGDGVVATALGANQYQAIFNGVSGPAGLRPLKVIAWDTATNFTVSVINVDVGGIPLAMVPAVTGFTQAAATTAITNAGLILGTVMLQSSSTVPSGEVISETPPSGTVVNPGSAVNLVIATGAPLAISGPASLPIGTVGMSYTANMTATGGAGGYTWSATGLPNGLGLGMNTGAITGTPSTSTGSPFAVKVTVTDANSATASMNYGLIVNSLAVCEVAKGNSVTVADVQLMINEALGVASAGNDLNGDRVVNAADAQIVINAALGLGCGAF
jgi:hypothetical protein